MDAIWLCIEFDPDQGCRVAAGARALPVQAGGIVGAGALHRTYRRRSMAHGTRPGRAAPRSHNHDLRKDRVVIVPGGQGVVLPRQHLRMPLSDNLVWVCRAVLVSLGRGPQSRSR